MEVALAVALTFAFSLCPSLGEISTRIERLKKTDWEGETSEGVAGSALRSLRTVAWDEKRRVVSVGWFGERRSVGARRCAEVYAFGRPETSHAAQLREVEFSFWLEPSDSARGVVDGLRRQLDQPNDAEPFTEVCIDCGNAPPRAGHRWRDGPMEVELMLLVTSERVVDFRWTRKKRSPR